MTATGTITQPRYLRLAADLGERIRRAEWRPGEALPPERRIGSDYNVSRVTVRRALEQLTADGLIEARQGAGTFVTERVRQPLSVLTSFSEDVRARGMAPTSEWLDRGTGIASPEEAIGLGLKPGQGVTRLARLRRADGTPLAIERAALVPDVLPDPLVVDESLYAALDRRQARPVRAVQRLAAIGLLGRAAEWLEVAPGSPGLLIIRVGYHADGRPIEYTRSEYRGDRWDFITELA
ncbi:MAG: GntR family transcriptional regulator [Pseudomonadota bacterium]